MKRCPRCGNALTQENNSSRAVCPLCAWQGPVCFGEQWDAASAKCRGGNDPTFWDEQRGHKRPQCEHYQACSVARNEPPVTRPTTTPTVPTMPTAPTPALPPLPTSYPTMVRPPGNPVALPQARPPVPPLPQAPAVVPVGLPSSVSNALINQIQQGQARGQLPQQQVLPRPAQVQHPYPQYPQQYPQQYQPQYPQQYPQQYQPQYPQQYQPQYQHQGQLVPMGPQANMPQYIPQNFVIPGQQLGSPLSNPEPVDSQGWWAMVGWSLVRGGIKGAGLSFLSIIDNIQLGPFFAKK